MGMNGRKEKKKLTVDHPNSAKERKPRSPHVVLAERGPNIRFPQGGRSRAFPHPTTDPKKNRIEEESSNL